MIVHVDMDAFYASVEKLDNPELADKCVIVGGVSGRGVVSAASYEARRYGVRSAMPMYQARRLCPHGFFVTPRQGRYKIISGQIMEILGAFSPLVEPVSIDEAYLDISGCRRLFGDPESTGRHIKETIYDKTGLTCSVGMAPLKFLAKISSDLKKPDGLVVINPKEVADFIKTLPVQKVPGVGRVSARELLRMGISTLGEVQKYDKAMLVGRLGKYGIRIYELANGIDRSRILPVRPVKSVSSEQTLSEDTGDKNVLKKYLLAQAEDVGRQLRRHRLRAKTVFIKIKHSDFTQITRQAPLPSLSSSASILYRAGAVLLDACGPAKPVRLVGLGVSDLVGEATPVQQDLFAESDEGCKKWERVDTAMDEICRRFGTRKITRAACSPDSGDKNERK